MTLDDEDEGPRALEAEEEEEEEEEEGEEEEEVAGEAACLGMKGCFEGDIAEEE